MIVFISNRTKKNIGAIFKWLRFYIFIFLLIPLKISAQLTVGKVTVKGAVNADIRYYNASKKLNRRPPLVATLNAQPELKIGKWEVPVRILMGTYQAPYRDFNRFGISPHYKWITFHAGHTTLNWSPLILEGRPVLGAGCELMPGNIRFGIFAGILNHASGKDTINGRIFFPVFSRQMLSVRLGYGSKENFIDIVVLTATDKQSSLDSVKAIGLRDASNGVYGINGAKQITKKIGVSASIGYSAYTADKDAKGEDRYNTFSGKIGGGLITRNASTAYAGAYNAGIKYRISDFNLLKKSFSDVFASLDYNRIDPGYQSMGLYYLINDIERIRAGLQLRTKDQKIYVTGNLGWEHNNIRNTQKVNNRRIISGINANYRYSKNWVWNINLQNYAVRLGIDRLNLEDTLIVNQVNRNATISALGFVGRSVEKAQLTALLNYQVGKNRIGDSTGVNLVTYNILLGYRSAPINKFILSPSLSFYHYKTFAYTSTRYIPSVAAEKNFHNNKFMARADIGCIVTYFAKKYNSVGWRNAISGQWNINAKNSLQVYIMYQQNFSKTFPLTELQANVRYGFRF